MGVYVVTMKGTSFFKIGHTKSFDVRMKAIGHASPVEVECVGWWPAAGLDVELAVLHDLNRLHPARRTRGEWFEFTTADFEKAVDLIVERAGRAAHLVRHGARGHLVLISADGKDVA